MKIRKLLAEFFGTTLLAASIVGSGIMATNLTKDVALQLLIVAIATVFMLATIIQMLGPISGGHFNPAVTLVELINKKITAKKAAYYVVSQTLGAVLGVIIANVMFDLPAIATSSSTKTSSNLLFSEVVATAGLIVVIQLIGAQKKGRYLPLAVAAWIGSAYFFTSSTTFANPAVTFARSLSDTFAGIEMSSVPGFVIAQLLGAVIGVGIAKGLSSER